MTLVLYVFSNSPDSVRMRENTGQKNFEYGHLLRSDGYILVYGKQKLRKRTLSI